MPASMQNWVCTNCAPAAILAASVVGLPARRRIDRRVGGAEEERRPCPRPAAHGADSPSSRIARAISVSARESRSNTGLASGWSPAVGSSPRSSSRLRTPSAAAPISSPCSAMRLRSRQVSWRIGSMPGAGQDRGRGRRRHVGAGAGAVGDIDRVGEPCERQRLAQEIAGIARHRRHDLGGDHERAGPQARSKAPGERPRSGWRVRRQCVWHRGIAVEALLSGCGGRSPPAERRIVWTAHVSGLPGQPRGASLKVLHGSHAEPPLKARRRPASERTAIYRPRSGSWADLGRPAALREPAAARHKRAQRIAKGST